MDSRGRRVSTGKDGRDIPEWPSCRSLSAIFTSTSSLKHKTQQNPVIIVNINGVHRCGETRKSNSTVIMCDRISAASPTVVKWPTLVQVAVVVVLANAKLTH